MQFVMLMPSILFIILGIVFLSGKGAFLIAGFNTMPKSEQEKYDTVSMCKFMGKMMFLLALGPLFWFFSTYFNIGYLFIIGMVWFLAVITFLLIYMNTGNRFKK